jgi:predicted MFS family arabinose efflux permease
MATAILRSRHVVRQRFSLALVWSNYRSVFRNPKAVLCYSTVFLEGVAFYGIFPYVAAIIRLRDAGGPSEAGFIIGAIGAGGLLYVASVVLLLRRFDRPQFMAAGGVLMAVGPLVLAAGPPWPFAVAGFAVSGFGFMLLHNSIQTETVDLAPAARQSAYSLHALSFFSGQAVGPVVFGWTFSHLGSAAALLVNAAVLIATGLLMSRRFRRLRPA